MSTRSAICIQKPDGSYAANYCQYDGYYSWNGVRLMEHWHSRQRAALLTSMGDMSGLGKVIGQQHDFDWENKIRERCRYDGTSYEDQTAIINDHPQKREEWCTFYGRDRGDKDSERIGGNFNTYLAMHEWFNESWCQYLYVWQAETWWTPDFETEGHPLIPLMAALAVDNDIPKPIKVGPAPYLCGRSARLMNELPTYVEPPARFGSGRAIVI